MVVCSRHACATSGAVVNISTIPAGVVGISNIDDEPPPPCIPALRTRMQDVM